MLRRLALLALATCIDLFGAGIGPADAVTVFTDQSAFLQALTDSAMTYTFDEFTHLQVLTNQLPGLTFSNAVVYDEEHYPSGGAFQTPPNVLLNADLYEGGPIAFTFDPSVDGVGFFNTSIVDAERVTLFDAQGATLFTGDLPDSSVNFLGIISDTPIHSGTVRRRPPTNGTIFIDNFSFGHMAQSSVEMPRGFDTLYAPMLDIESLVPNPFNASMTVWFDARGSVNVSLEVYDVTGRRVRTMVLGAYGPGRCRVEWDGCDEHGNTLASGMYLMRVRSGTEVSRAAKVILAR